MVNSEILLDRLADSQAVCIALRIRDTGVDAWKFGMARRSMEIVTSVQPYGTFGSLTFRIFKANLGLGFGSPCGTRWLHLGVTV